MSKLIQIQDFSFKVLTSGGEKWKFHYFLASSDLWFLHKQSSRQHSSVEASRACVHEVVSSNPGGAYFFFFNNFSLLFFNALVIPYFIQTDMSNFFPTFFQLFSIFSIFFSTCSQHVPNLFPIFPQLFSNFSSNFFRLFKIHLFSTLYQLFSTF